MPKNRRANATLFGFDFQRNAANVERMINILKRDFSGNQIIIASIFNYNFETVNIIELSNRL